MPQYQDLSLRQASHNVQAPVTLPPFNAIDAIAGKACTGGGNLYQAPTAVYHANAYDTIEASTPSTANSMPGAFFDDRAYDTTSISSSSRESSAYPRGSGASTVRAPPPSNSRARSTRAKRGSVSSNSDSDRSSKRQNKQHESKTKKIVSEKTSRDDQAHIFQNFEDVLQICLGFYADKQQQPNNKKKSGLVDDKKQVLTAFLIMGLVAIKMLKRHGDETFNQFTEETKRLTAQTIAEGATIELPVGCLLTGPNGEGPCAHERTGRTCDTPIECRKSRRHGHWMRNTARGPKL